MINSSYNEDKRFLALLQKWQSGDFTRADEQEMNALAGADEFRKEALDGLLEHPEFDYGQALASLSKKIREKQPARKFAFPQIMALAAALALFFVAIWFFNIHPIAQDQNKIALELPQTTDTIGEADGFPITVPMSQQEPGFSENSESNPPLPPPSSAEDEKMEQALATESQDFGGSVVLDDQDENSQYGNAAVSEQKSKEQYERPGAIIEQSTNAIPPAERAQQAAGRSAKKAQTKPSPTYSKDQLKQPEPDKEAPLAAKPKDGWDNFRMYLNTNARLTPEALANNVTGTVRLQFLLDDKNIPVDFKVLQGLGYGCDELAIKLVKDYSWEPGTSQPIVIDIPFVR